MSGVTVVERNARIVVASTQPAANSVAEAPPKRIVRDVERALVAVVSAPQGLPATGDGALHCVAGGPVSGHRAVIEIAPGVVAHADLTALSGAELLLGISRNAAANGGQVDVVTTELLSDPSFAFVPDLPVFAGQSGLLTQTAPEYPLALWSVCLGVALSPTQMRVNIEPPIFLG